MAENGRAVVPDVLISNHLRREEQLREFLAALEKETVAFGKPVVYVHGDTHIFRVDKPLFGGWPWRSRRCPCRSRSHEDIDSAWS